MSFSSANEKYRKYENLLYKDPTNSLYKRKLQKYKLVASQSYNHTGGNSYIQGYKNENKTRDLIGKIQNLLSRVQQNPSDMNGGSRKNISTNSHKASQVKGYRTMRGGTNVDDIIAKNKAIGIATLESVGNYVQKTTELKENLRISNEYLQKKTAEYDNLVLQRDALQGEVATLQQSIANMNAAAGTASTELQRKLDELTATSLQQINDLKTQIGIMTPEINILKQNIAQIKAENAKLKTEFAKSELDKELAQKSLAELTTRYDADTNRLAQALLDSDDTLEQITKSLVSP